GAFCFYYYWFGGRRLLERPIDLFLANQQIEMPFCICWANEPWTRRWDGLEEDVLIDQPHTPESDARFILDVIPILNDPRYLRVNGKPILLVYRAALLSLPVTTTSLWRQLCLDAGVGEIELTAVESFGFESPEDYGFDSTVEFPPHGFDAPEVKIKPIKKKKPFEGKVWRYADAAAFYCSQPNPPWKRYRGVMPAWDNTPRLGRKGYAFIKSNPSRYSMWLACALKETRAQFAEGERLVFINAWNEWGEGAILEPDQKNGRAYLEATRNTLLGLTDWNEQLSYLTKNDGQNDVLIRQNAAEVITAQMEAYQRTLEFMVKQSDGYLPKGSSDSLTVVTDVWLSSLEKDQSVNKVLGVIDQLGTLNHPEGVPFRRYKPLKIFGWMLIPDLVPIKPPSIYIMFVNQEDSSQVFFAEIKKRLPRPDLYDAFKLKSIEETKFAGFDAMLDCSNMSEGSYTLILLQEDKGEWSMSSTPNILKLV
ncbi:MAG: glycoside hydrolase family 99-like domain-containing protein, partial [Methylococcales bacterium]|nr:glycoside hydrolase family 99-like domain-containing protein [Methylococcales bacterium]